MQGFKADIGQVAMENEAFRREIYTAQGAQLVVMSLEPGQDIGEEVHEDVDQFIWIVEGRARARLDGEESTIEAGEVLAIPRGVSHNIINDSRRNPLKLYTVYAPPEHPAGTVHQTKEDAEAAEHEGD